MNGKSKFSLTVAILLSIFGIFNIISSVVGLLSLPSEVGAAFLLPGVILSSIFALLGMYLLFVIVTIGNKYIETNGHVFKMFLFLIIATAISQIYQYVVIGFLPSLGETVGLILRIVFIIVSITFAVIIIKQLYAIGSKSGVSRKAGIWITVLFCLLFTIPIAYIMMAIVFSKVAFKKNIQTQQPVSAQTQPPENQPPQQPQVPQQMVQQQNSQVQVQQQQPVQQMQPQAQTPPQAQNNQVENGQFQNNNQGQQPQ